MAKKLQLASELYKPDESLSVSGRPADAKITGDMINQLSEDIEQLKQSGSGSGSGATTAQSNSLWAIIQKTAFTEALTDEELNTFKTAWGIVNSGDSGDEETTEKTLSSISASYSGGNVTVGTSVNDLTGITVTATYSDGSTSEITGYTLSGEILEGSNTITVSYGGKTTTFTVIGVVESSGGEEETEPLYGVFWPPMSKVTDWSNPVWGDVDNFVNSGNSGLYIDAGFPEGNFIRLDKLQGTIYIRTLSTNLYGTLEGAYKCYANSDGEFSTGGFTSIAPTIIRSFEGEQKTIEVNEITYYFVLFKFEIPSEQYGYFVSAQNSGANGYFISSDNIYIDEEYKQYYTLFTSDPSDRITEGAMEVI